MNYYVTETNELTQQREIITPPLTKNKAIEMLDKARRERTWPHWETLELIKEPEPGQMILAL